MARDGWVATPTGRAASGFGVGLLLAVSIVGGGDGGSDESSVAPLPLQPLADPDLSALDDGFGHFVVELPAGQGAEALAGTDGVVDVTPAGGPYWAVTTTLDAGALAEAAVGVGAVGISEDVPMVASGSTNDPFARWQWALDNTGGATFGQTSPAIGVRGADIGGAEARAASAGTGIVVAVVDSGFQTDHPDLPAEQLWHNDDDDCGDDVDDDDNGYVDDCEGWDFVHDDDTPFDPASDNDHGTHVAGTIAAVPDNGIGSAGLSPGVTLMNLKVLEDDVMWMSDGAAAIRYAVDNGADVINLSWGSMPGVSESLAAALEAAVDDAIASGVVVVAAAGNGGDDLDRNPQYPAALPQPELLTVGASRADEMMAPFSNYGAESVDLFAPGHYIIGPVDDGGYAAMQGTSTAAPHVAAAAAIVLASDPELSVDEVTSRLLSTVDQSAGYANRSATDGRLDVAAAIGIDTDDANPLVITVDGVDELAAGVAGILTIDAELVDRSLAAGRDLTLRATLLVEYEGDAYALPGLPVTVNGTPTTTDAQASVALSGTDPGGDRTVTGAGVHAEIGVTLPAGTYALAVELVDAEDPGVAYGPAQAVFLEIGASVDGPVTSTDPTAPGLPTTPSVTLPGVPGVPGLPGLPGLPPRGDGSPAPTTGSPSGGAATTSTTAPAAPPAGDPQPQRDSGEPARVGVDVGGGPRNDGASNAPATAETPGSTAPAGRADAPSRTTDNETAPSSEPGGGSDNGGSGSRTPAATPSNGEQPRPQTPVEHDGMRITSVRPPSGPIAGGNAVTISGEGFPDNVRVTFDGRGGQVVSASADQLVVVAPSSPVTGAVDIRVADFVGNDVTMANAYEYVGPNRPPSSGTSTGPTADPEPSDTPTTPSTGVPSPTTAPASEDPVAPTTAEPGATPPDSGGPRPLDGRFRLALSATVSSSNGLVMARVTAGNPISADPGTWADLACRESSCRAVLR